VWVRVYMLEGALHPVSQNKTKKNRKKHHVRHGHDTTLGHLFHTTRTRLM